MKMKTILRELARDVLPREAWRFLWCRKLIGGHWELLNADDDFRRFAPRWVPCTVCWNDPDDDPLVYRPTVKCEDHE